MLHVVVYWPNIFDITHYRLVGLGKISCWKKIKVRSRARGFATRLGNLRMHVIFLENAFKIGVMVTLFFYRGFEVGNGRYFRHVTQRFIG